MCGSKSAAEMFAKRLLQTTDVINGNAGDFLQSQITKPPASPAPLIRETAQRPEEQRAAVLSRIIAFLFRPF
jgi:hypothetical protein